MYDEEPTAVNRHYADFVSSIVCGSLSDGAKHIYNVFTEIYNDNRIESIKKDLSDNGSVISEMTGSGSVVFGVFENEDKAVQAKNALSEKYTSVFITRPTDCGVSVLER